SRSGDPQATRIDPSAHLRIGMQPSEQACPDAPLGSPVLPVRRIIGGALQGRVWGNPGQLAARGTSYDGEFGRAEGTESGVGKGLDPLGLLCRGLLDGGAHG